jgi:S1-C subfamily serine protease
MRMDRRWFPARECKRDDVNGTWPCKPWADSDGDQLLPPATTSYAKTADPIVNKLAPSLVLVNFDMPYSVSGITERSYYGTGLILDAERGLVLVDRNTVPTPLGDVRLTFSGTIEIPGRVEYVHPLHNLAVVSYDPKLIGTTPARSATLRATELHPGEEVWAVGVRPDGKVQSRSATIASIDPVAYPLSRTLQFRDSNLETIALVNGPSDYDGVLVNKSGEVLANWASFAYESGRDVAQENRGIPADLLIEMLPLVRDGRALHSLEVELQPVPLASARKLGLTDEWVQRLEQHSPERRQVLGVQRLVGGAPATQLLKSGDLILDVDGVVVNRFREVERAVQKNSVRLSGPARRQRAGGRCARTWRSAAATSTASSSGGRSAAETASRCRPSAASPRTASSWPTSPTARHRPAISCGPAAIVEVDGQRSMTWMFVRAVSGREDRSSLRLKTVSWNGSVEVITLKVDQRYWPSYELRRTDQG